MRELCVIFNPTAGRGRAAKRLEAVKSAWGDRAEFRATQYAGHAIELARQAALDGFQVVAAAGGDGTVHEVSSGILLAGRSEVEFAIVPIGSANDYHHSLFHGSTNFPRLVDVGAIQSPDGRKQFFVCNTGIGFGGAVTLESRKIKLLQGILLYGLATLKALFRHYQTAPLEVTLDDGAPQSWPTLMFSILLGRREGGFVFAPEASLDDGLFDYVHAGDLSRWQVLKFLPKLASSGPPSDHPHVRLGKCRRVKLTSPGAMIIHVDGEFFCLPQDNVREVEIELLPKALKVRGEL